MIISKQSSTTFSDKEQVWADNAASSRFFGNVYVCWASFRSNSRGQALPDPAHRRPVDATAATRGRRSQVGPATDNGINAQADGCTVRTDSHGNVYVFGIGVRGGQNVQLMYTSTDGGAHWTGPTLVASAVTARASSTPCSAARRWTASRAPASTWRPGRASTSPTVPRPGAGATNEIVMTWADGAAGLNHEQLLLTWSTNGGADVDSAGRGARCPPVTVPSTPRRPCLPDGTDLYVVAQRVHDAVPQRHDQSSAAWWARCSTPNVAAGMPSGWSTLHRGAVGDPRGSSQNGLTAEFLGDYVYAAATRDGAVSVWNDTSARRRLPGDRRLPGVAVHEHADGPAQRAGRLPGGIRQQRHPRRTPTPTRRPERGGRR